MNIFIVRTRLQALIVEKIISTEDKNKYVLVKCYQNNKHEDAPEVYSVYKRIEKNALFSLDILSCDKISINISKYFFIHLLSFITNGKIFLAGIDSYPFAISSKIFPFSTINTFDDGTANFLSYSKYFKETPLNRKGIKGVIANTLFPKGGAKYLRDRTKCHYTIFSSLNNIVEKGKLVVLEWDWSELLDHRDLKKIPPNTNVILLGTAFHDLSQMEYLQSKVLKLLCDIDLYIMHPRERLWLENIKVNSLHSPAEAVLKYIADKNEVKLKVYHFNSTAAYSLSNNMNIEFIDLLAGE
tara:strand:+ start:14483 stop:15376 length:894 start_codon:yes stop_codon:yes gene_type:complete